MLTASEIIIYRAVYSSENHRAAIRKLMAAYALDPMGGESAMSNSAISRLPDVLATHPTAGTLLAFVGCEPAGLANFFLGLSTFRAEPLLNVHDLFIMKEFRGLGIGRELLRQVEREANSKECCKITLEVRQDNFAAIGLYEELGFTSFIMSDRPTPEIILQKLLTD